MAEKLITSPDRQRFGLYTNLINNGRKGSDRSLCVTICASMLLAVVMYIEEHFPADGRDMIKDWLKAYYARLDGEDQIKQ